MDFSTEEYAHRLSSVQSEMRRRGLDLLLCVDPANLYYLSGYDGWSFYVPQALLVALDQDQPYWIGRGMDANAARVTTFLDDAHILPYPDHFVQAGDRHAMDYIGDWIRSRGWQRARIGVEMDAYYYTAAAHAALCASLPSAAFEDAKALVNWVRVIKSPAEIEMMRQAGKVLEVAMATAIERIRPGVRQCDAVAEIYAAQTRGTGEFGGHYTSICPLLPTGAGANNPHLTWTEEPYRRGESTIVELAGARRRYHAPMARTLHLGQPSRRLAEYADIVLDGVAAALAQMRPGVTAESVEAVWREVIGRRGLKKESRLGYSIGVGYPPDWGEHTISLRPGDRTELRAGMTLHLMAGVWGQDWGVEFSEPVLITERGHELLASFPRELVVID